MDRQTTWPSITNKVLFLLKGIKISVLYKGAGFFGPSGTQAKPVLLKNRPRKTPRKFLPQSLGMIGVCLARRIRLDLCSYPKFHDTRNIALAVG